MKITHIEPNRVGIGALSGWSALLSVQCRLEKMREPHTGFLKLLTHNLDIRLNVAIIYFDGPGGSVARRTVLNASSFLRSRCHRATTVLGGMASSDLGALPNVTSRCSQVSSRPGVLGTATYVITR